MEAYKRQFQIRCSHHELEYSARDKRITCAICGKVWAFAQERGYAEVKQVFAAEKDDYVPMV
jgi:ribosomal protein S27E